MFATLIDKDGFKIDFDMKHFLEEKYLENGEEIIEKDWQIANSMLKPKWDFDNEVWIEIATEEEIEASKPPQIDNCSEKTTEQKLEEAQEEIAHLKENELILAENIYQLANVIELLVGGAESGQV